MNTKNRGEQQLTLLEFSEEQQFYHKNIDGSQPQSEFYLPIGWLPWNDAYTYLEGAKLRLFGEDGKRLASYEEAIDDFIRYSKNI